MSQSLRPAVELLRAGRWVEAEAHCRQMFAAGELVLSDVLMENADGQSQNDLGVLLARLGRMREATDCFQAALRTAADRAPTLDSAGRLLAAQAHGNLGNALKAQGRVDEAIDHYQRALEINPQGADALFNWALVCQQSGRLEEAIDSYRRAVAIRGDFVEARFNLALLLRDAGQGTEACHAFENVVSQRPAFVEARAELAALYCEQREYSAAASHYREVLRRRPGADVAANLGFVLRQLHEYDEALQCCQQAVQLDPACAEAHCTWGLVLLDRKQPAKALVPMQAAVRLRPDLPEIQDAMGAVLESQGDFAAALVCFREAVRLRPDGAQMQNNLGVILQKVGRIDEAAECFERALRLDPQLAEAHNGLGTVYSAKGQLDAGVAAFERTVQLDSAATGAHNNLGVLLRRQGRFAAALEHFDRAIALDHQLPASHVNRAVMLLLRGDFAGGWEEYEWRRRTETAVWPPSHDWDGTPLEGRTILLRTEQGLGDTLQFIRYASLVHDRGGRVLVACPRNLIPLLSTSPGVDRCCPQDEPLPAFDVEAPLLSLPRILCTDVTSIPSRVPYLEAREDLVSQWRSQLAGPCGLRIGIAWQGNPGFPDDRYRSIPLAEFAPLAAIPGVRLISLQKGYGTEQLAATPLSVEDFGNRLDNTGTAFCDTAALIKNLDLVISSDTAVVHLAGALGSPMWMATALAPDWRWLLDRSDSPWYPTLRLFRQARLDHWADVFAKMAEQLALRGG